MKKENIKRVTFEFNSQLFKEFKKATVEKEIPMRYALENFMREYIKGDKDASRAKNTNS